MISGDPLPMGRVREQHQAVALLPFATCNGLKHRSWPTLSWRGLVFFCLGPVLMLLTLSGTFSKVDRLLGDLNFSLWSRPGTSDLVLVEIDSRSLQKLDSWPWSRTYHAALIQRLSQAGAAE